MTKNGLTRRRVVSASSALGAMGLVGCAGGRIQTATQLPLVPIRASTDRIFDMSVCLRPFRAAGPRLDTEMIGDTLVVHNYGHGGSGWSLSWGSGTIAVQKAMAGSPREVAVIGCGALGLTAAILAQRAGAKVTIYAREFLPQTRSARATGSWTPDSRIALTQSAGPGFAAVWEQMARISFSTYRTYLGLPGEPVAWVDSYMPSDLSHDDPNYPDHPADPLGFASYQHQHLADLRPGVELLPAGSTPFAAPFVYLTSSMMFNISSYGHTLLDDFMLGGGRLVHKIFRSPADIAALREKVVIDCPGYGARELWRDESITPVRGQVGRLIPQADVKYSVYYKDIFVLPRSDGILVQAIEGGDMKGYGDSHETVDRAETERAVEVLSGLYRPA